MKRMVMLGMIIFSSLGGWLGTILDSNNSFGGWTILLTTVGGLFGVWAGYKAGKYYF